MDEIDKFINKYGKELIKAIKIEVMEMEDQTGEEGDENTAYALGYFVATFAKWAERKDPMFDGITNEDSYIIDGMKDHL